MANHRLRIRTKAELFSSFQFPILESQGLVGQEGFTEVMWRSKMVQYMEERENEDSSKQSFPLWGLLFTFYLLFQRVPMSRVSLQGLHNCSNWTGVIWWICVATKVDAQGQNKSIQNCSICKWPLIYDGFTYDSSTLECCECHMCSVEQYFTLPI